MRLQPQLPRRSAAAARAARGGARDRPLRGRQGTFRYRDWTLAYEARGEGERPFILIHGLLLPSWVNGQVATLLAERGNRVLLLDLIGHGRSDQPVDASVHRLEYAAEQVVALMDHLGLDDAVIGGMSLGANVSLETAVRFPERVRAIVAEMPVLESGAVPVAVTLFPLMMALRHGGPPLRALFRAVQHLPRTANEPLNAVLDTGGNPEAMAAVMHGYGTGPMCPPVSERMKIAAPTLVIGHRWDWMHVLSDAEHLVDELPNGRLVNARHFLEMRTRPDRLVAEVATFLDEVA